MAPICLVAVPYGPLERPALGLALLKSILAGAGLEASVAYFTFAFADAIGTELYHQLSESPPTLQIAERTFARAAFGSAAPDASGWLDLLGSTAIGRSLGDVRERLAEVEREAGAFADRMAAEVLAGRPRIVGVGSTFQQNCAALALLRRIRDLDPDVITVMGGANCEAPMGARLVREFEQVDVAVSGEADGIVVGLCRALLEGGRDADLGRLGPGVFSARRVRGLRGPSPGDRATAGDLDLLPAPDFDEYFAAREASASGGDVTPGLPVETSRGCWWGAKHHCTFCGLNGSSMAFRSKSPDRVLRELETLSARHGLFRFEVVDNILDMGYVRTLVPRLAELGAPYSIFYETKANLTREQVRALAAAGIRWIQPGIESLCDGVLRLIDKGTTAATNLELLKWALESGVHVFWNLLHAVPGERDEWYAEVAGWLPAIEHLQPPAGLCPVRIDRYSPYHQHPEQHGLRLVPSWGYRHVYPLSPEALEEVAYFFEDEASGRRERELRRLEVGPGVRSVRDAVDGWRARWEETLPELVLEGNRVLDTRRVASAGVTALDPCERTILDLTLRARKTDRVRQEVERTLGAGAPFESRLRGLVERRFVLDLGGDLLALPVARPSRPLPSSGEHPAGSVVVQRKAEWRP